MLACRAVAIFYRINNNVVDDSRCYLEEVLPEIIFYRLLWPTRDNWTVLVRRDLSFRFSSRSRLPVSMAVDTFSSNTLQRFVLRARPLFSPLPSGAAIPVSAIYIVIPSPGVDQPLNWREVSLRVYYDDYHTYKRTSRMKSTVMLLLGYPFYSSPHHRCSRFISNGGGAAVLMGAAEARDPSEMTS